VKISIIAAINSNRGIGKNNRLLYHIPHDLGRFRNLTIGKPIIMGRKTYESIVSGLGGSPLADRTNIVLTKGVPIDDPDVYSAPNLHKALEIAAEHGEEVFIIGGQRAYEEALPLTKRLYLTLINDSAPADTYFPYLTSTPMSGRSRRQPSLLGRCRVR
jgi:dihydrofolate reductase